MTSGGGVRVELRDMEVFLTLAEELHFSRTAERLHLTRARVSQVIKKLERTIGGELFERTNRRVALTPLGEQLRDDLAGVRANLRHTLERAKLAAAGKPGVLRLGMLSWDTEVLRPVYDAFAAREPDCVLQFRSVSFGDPFGALRAGDVDIVTLWLPVREPDLTTGPTVLVEDVVLAMSADHPLAGRESVTYEDVADHVVMGGARPDYWRQALVPSHTPGGRPLTLGPTVSSFQEMILILATGEAVSFAHAHTARLVPRPDIVYVPVSDAPRARWALVWRTDTGNGFVRAFADTVRDLGPLES